MTGDRPLHLGEVNSPRSWRLPPELAACCGRNLLSEWNLLQRCLSLGGALVSRDDVYHVCLLIRRLRGTASGGKGGECHDSHTCFMKRAGVGYFLFLGTVWFRGGLCKPRKLPTSGCVPQHAGGPGVFLTCGAAPCVTRVVAGEPICRGLLK